MPQWRLCGRVSLQILFGVTIGLFGLCLTDGQPLLGVGDPAAGAAQPPNVFRQIPPLRTDEDNGPYYKDRGNLYPYGLETKHDVKLVDREAQTGRQVDLLTYFPYYGARYNYSIISVHGYITFGDLLDDGLDFLMGDEVKDWPEQSDPATIAVYACRQKEVLSLPSKQRGVYYRLVLREKIRGKIPTGRLHGQRYVDTNGDAFLNQLEIDLKDGMVGAQNFHADAALVVTWENVTFYQASRDDQETKRATYQAVFMTDGASQLSYVILNYHTLGYSGADILGQAKRGRCKAQFNGGNQTGVVLVDPIYSKFPSQLASMSAVPHRVGGRYLFRVDDIVRRGGCSNMTSGTYRMTIYPDLVNAMGDVNIQVNGPCLTSKETPVLQVAEYRSAVCRIKNPAIAECKMIKYYHWGTKNVYLKVGFNKAYIGSIYYVPPGLDPLQLDIGSHASWFERKAPLMHRIKWYPGNFTNDRGNVVSSLRLALWGYKEHKDDRDKKFLPVLEKIGILNMAVPNTVVTDKGEGLLDLQPATPQWVGNGERDLWTYRFGFLRLYEEDNTQPSGEGGGIWSPPIPLHWWWGHHENDVIERVSIDKCMEWYNEDGHQWNFIMDTETNSSCPCRLEQALLDMGRYMPHPRCSERMRNLGCDAYIGAKECFLSAQNVQGNYVTHYGQVCCYDRDGYLMQTSYQTVVQVENYPYSPGFPQRAYEFGTYPYTKQFEIPALSNYYHDVMPYFFCCKWVKDHCQFFYWRRPSSGCQNYQPCGVSTVMGAGHFVTVDGLKYIYNEPGTYVLLHKPETKGLYDRYQSQPPSPEVFIEVRLERYPDRSVDFSHREIPQADLVQPSNVSVVTGVAIQEGSNKESDRVVIVLRKDTRRVKYRLNVLVQDELRYFDVVTRQKFRGVMIYVNDWKEGQSEIYASLDKSRIGIRVRESYAAEIGKNLIFEESYGLLDVMVSIPPEYQVFPDPTGHINWQHALAGLVGTFSNTVQDDFLEPSRRTTGGAVAGATDAAASFAQKWQVDNVLFRDLFTLTNQDHETWPEAALFGPVYPFAKQTLIYRPFVAQYNITFNQEYAHCSAALGNDRSCPRPDMMLEIERVCLQMYECKYDYFETRQSALAAQVKQEWVRYNENRLFGTQKYNSCGAINIEYPEYLLIDPPTGRLYLEGDTVHFDCYQEHWVKGQSFFKCLQGGWTKGYQPWCRSKQLENTQKILAIVFGILFFILVLLGVFLCCFCVRKSRQTRGRDYRTAGPIPTLKDVSDPKSKPEQAKVTVTGVGVLPLASRQDSEWKPTKDFEPTKKPVVVESYNASTRSSPVALEKPTKHNTYTPPTVAKKTWV